MTALAATVRNLMVILGDYLQITRIAFGTIYRISTTCLGTTAANNSQNHIIVCLFYLPRTSRRKLMDIGSVVLTAYSIITHTKMQTE